MLTQRFGDALDFAFRAHRDQTRKGTSIPYFSHLMSVAALVCEYGGDEDQAIAALLHDLPEDHGGKEALIEIQRTFGDRVASIVEACSDTFESPKPEWKERKEKYLERLAGEPEDVALVSAADKIHNLRMIIQDYGKIGEDFWRRFSAPRDEQLWYYRGCVSALKETGASAIVSDLESCLLELEGMVEA